MWCGQQPLTDAGRSRQADTASFGITLQSESLRGLSASVDYYHINLKQVISAYPAPTYLQNCLTSGDPIYGGAIVRTPNGELFGATVAGGGYVNGTAQNIAGTIVSGVDVVSNYRLPLSGYKGTWELAFKRHVPEAVDHDLIPRRDTL